jgi:hypothetical protein
MQQYNDIMEQDFNDGAWMQQQDDQDHFLMCSIQALESVNKKISKLLLKKEELTDNIISAFGHDKEGQKSYDFHTWKIEVRTPFIYSLNKKLYESGEYNIPKKFNPIKKSVSYSIDKKFFDKFEEAPFEVREQLIELIEKKPGKAAVNIKTRSQ